MKGFCLVMLIRLIVLIVVFIVKWLSVLIVLLGFSCSRKFINMIGLVRLFRKLWILLCIGVGRVL